MDSGFIELLAILAPTIGVQIKEYISKRGKDLKYTELQILLLSKSIEDITFTRESIKNFNLVLQSHFEQENITLLAIQKTLELLAQSQRQLRGELVQSGVIK